MIPGLGRSTGGGHGNPLQCSCLENPHRQRSLAGYSPLGRKESAMTEPLSTAHAKFTLCIIPISFPLLTHLLLISFSLSLSFFFCVLTLFPNSGWPSSLPDLPRVAASLFIFSLNTTCLHPNSWLSACSPDKLRFSFFFLLCRVESCSTENLELRKKVEVLENTNR